MKRVVDRIISIIRIQRIISSQSRIKTKKQNTEGKEETKEEKNKRTK